MDEIERLRQLVIDEGERLAKRVRAGEFTRADVEQMVAETGDGEPVIALQFLDYWDQNG